MVSFMIPSIPESCNSLYNVLFHLRRVELKPECFLWKSKAKTYMPPFSVSSSGMLRMEATFFYPLYYKNGKLKKKDSTNMLKLLQDAVSERYGLDDKFITEGTWKAVDSDSERTEVKLCVI